MKKIIVSCSAMIVCAAISAGILAEAPAVYSNSDAAIDVLYSKNIITGFDDGELHPEYTLTRAQFAKFLCNAFPDAETDDLYKGFSDVSKDHWAEESIKTAVNSGWLEGFPDGTFRPDEEILYEQAIAVVCRAMNLFYYKPEYPSEYIRAAIEYSLNDRVNTVIGEKLNREQASRLILNCIDYTENQYGDDFSYSNFSNWAGGGSGGSVNAKSSANMTASAAPDEYGAVTEEAVMDSYAPEFSGMYGAVTDREEYSASEENVFKNTVTSPLSTFAIDTDTASYSNLRRFILNGQNIPSGSVRSEELINYFDYEMAETEDGVPFGVNYTVSSCPWNEENYLAMITVSGEEMKEKKPSNLVFLIDTSGSMYDYNKLPLVKRSLSMMLDKLDESDKVSIVTYASSTGVALEPTPATEKEKILGVINSLTAGGATAGASGINLAYEQAEKAFIDGNNRVILCTDGDFNVGISSNGDLEKLISEKRDSGIFLTVLGFGMGNYKDSRMELLADKGNGNYAYIDNLREAKKVLVDELPKTIYTIAKDVKIQVEFNPEKVASYRLVGYENRLLNNEDFDNDAKDGGELGSGSTVTVLYEIVPQNGEVESGLKYQKTEPTGSDELMNVKIRYKKPEGDESVLSEFPVSGNLSDNPGEDFLFASAVAELGMILNDSEYKGNSSFDSVIELARAGAGVDRFGIRNEFVQLADLLRFTENRKEN